MKFIELCAGSAAMTIFQLSGKRSLMPYQGSKWKFRKEISNCFGNPKITSVELYDPGPWGKVLPLVFDKNSRELIIKKLEEFSILDPGNVYNDLHKHAVSKDEIDFSAEFLFLQRLSYNGKSVAIKNHKWQSPGLNKRQAYGSEATDKFGKINPMIPSLIKNLKNYNFEKASVKGLQAPAPFPREKCKEEVIVYIDPPYQNSTGYPHGDLSRDEVISLSKAWYDAGASVFISEAVKIEDLIKIGWNCKIINSAKGGNSSFKSKKAEYITYKERIRNG